MLLNICTYVHMYVCGGNCMHLFFNDVSKITNQPFNMKMLINNTRVKLVLQHALSTHRPLAHIRMGVDGLIPIDNKWIRLLILCSLG